MIRQDQWKSDLNWLRNSELKVIFLGYGAHIARRLTVANCRHVGATGHSAITSVTLQLHDVTGKYELPHWS